MFGPELEIADAELVIRVRTWAADKMYPPTCRGKKMPR